MLNTFKHHKVIKKIIKDGIWSGWGEMMSSVHVLLSIWSHSQGSIGCVQLAVGQAIGELSCQMVAEPGKMR